ncbi:MAG TPA: hypothetical protein VLM91_01195 [Candidatus Methylomirabilis sp.]|nr:hypothetical protein [Candidatus Methylomirabilis sp.]
MLQRLPHLLIAICLLVASFPHGANSQSLPAPTPAPSGCTSEKAVTVPAEVNMGQVMVDTYALEDDHQEKLFHRQNRTLDQEMAKLFDRSTPRSKLEQFYTMLFHISRNASHSGDEITFDVAKALNLLLSSKVFSDPNFPRQIVQIHLNRKDRAHPHYQVVFNNPEVRLPLNTGLGFGVFREGMCQHAKALVFYGSFSFSLAMKKTGLEVNDFDNVDLWGTFGSRGIVDVDVNLVSLKSVEFLKGNAMGLVKAQVSRKEFEANHHSFLLKLLTRLVTDKSIQPIDW